MISKCYRALGWVLGSFSSLYSLSWWPHLVPWIYYLYTDNCQIHSSSSGLSLTSRLTFLTTYLTFPLGYLASISTQHIQTQLSDLHSIFQLAPLCSLSPSQFLWPKPMKPTLTPCFLCYTSHEWGSIFTIYQASNCFLTNLKATILVSVTIIVCPDYYTHFLTGFPASTLASFILSLTQQWFHYRKQGLYINGRLLPVYDLKKSTLQGYQIFTRWSTDMMQSSPIMNLDPTLPPVINIESRWVSVGKAEQSLWCVPSALESFFCLRLIFIFCYSTGFTYCTLKKLLTYFLFSLFCLLLTLAL